MTVIGPYDGRKARRKRCDPCIKRKIKCKGGLPCEMCTRTNRACSTVTKPGADAVVFVQSAMPGTNTEIFTHAKSAIPKAFHLADTNRYLPYFFTSFLQHNALTQPSLALAPILLHLSHNTPELRSALIAIGAQHYNRQTETESHDATVAYALAVRTVQSKINQRDFISDPSSLWTTFVLALFELQRDASAQNWLAHFLSGTATLLQFQNPDSLTTPGSPGQAFFLTTRIFEISRALLYADRTFLNTPVWRDATVRLWERDPARHSVKERLFDVLPGFVELHITTVALMESAQPSFAEMQTCAARGMLLQAQLRKCVEVCGGINHDPELDIARVYYAATSIYLDGTFSYFAPFRAVDSPLAPLLSEAAIHGCVQEILGLSAQLLNQDVAGVLLFFPLRVAGARAEGVERRIILQLLEEVASRGFVVSGRIKGDLRRLWGEEV